MPGKALRRAAGVLKRDTKSRKKSTATERATSASSIASEHAPAASRLPLTGLPMSASELQTTIEEDLEKIVALLLWMAQDFQSNIHRNDIHCEALEVLIKHVGEAGGTLGSLHTGSVAKLSKLIDIMMFHKDGSRKDANETLAFMRRVGQIREEVRASSRDNATERIESSDDGTDRVGSSDNATERVELDEEQVSLCYQKFGRFLLTDHLLPHQTRDPRYRLRYDFEGDTYLSRFQRSFTDNMLRKFLGDRKVAFVIWQHGLPSIADMGHATKRPGRGHATKRPGRVLDMGRLQGGLEECLKWFFCLANDIVIHRAQEGFDAQLSASSLDEQERQRQQTRREARRKVRDALRLGEALAQERDDHKRSYDEMNSAEQQILEDFETGRTEKQKQRFQAPRMPPFRCNLEMKQ